MNDVGIIWHYCAYRNLSQITEPTKLCNLHMNDVKSEDYPLLGRRVELMIVLTQIMLLDEPKNSPNRRRDLAAIIFKG